MPAVGTTDKSALWNGQVIDYTPGILALAIRPGYNRKGFQLIHDLGGKIVSFGEGGWEIAVAPEQTLRIAVELSKSNVFRFVRPVTAH